MGWLLALVPQGRGGCRTRVTCRAALQVQLSPCGSHAPRRARSTAGTAWPKVPCDKNERKYTNDFATT